MRAIALAAVIQLIAQLAKPLPTSLNPTATLSVSLDTTKITRQGLVSYAGKDVPTVLRTITVSNVSIPPTMSTRPQLFVCSATLSVRSALDPWRISVPTVLTLSSSQIIISVSTLLVPLEPTKIPSKAVCAAPNSMLTVSPAT